MNQSKASSRSPMINESFLEFDLKCIELKTCQKYKSLKTILERNCLILFYCCQNKRFIILIDFIDENRKIF